MNSNLIDFRKQIDQCDTELIQLLAKRFAITARVGELKKHQNLKSIDPKREQRQFKRIESLATENGISPDLASKLLRNIIDQVIVEHEAIKHSASIRPVNPRVSFGIIGMGDFGKLSKKHLSEWCKVECFDLKTKDSIEKVMGCEFVILAVPLSALKNVLIQIKPLLRTNTTLIDVCSVKQKPAEIYKNILPHHKNVVLTHPMFGPQSAANGLRGHTIIFCNQNAASKAVQKFCQEVLGLRVVRIPAVEHDQIMANMHALTFFVARGLNNLGLKPSKFQAPSFQMLLDLVDLDKAHSQELFETVECGNPNAATVRENFIKVLQDINAELC